MKFLVTVVCEKCDRSLLHYHADSHWFDGMDFEKQTRDLLHRHHCDWDADYSVAIPIQTRWTVEYHRH